MADQQSRKLEATELARLKSLSAYKILDTEPEQELDGITKMAAQLCDAPIALISLLDEKRQWFKSRVGIDATETPRDISFCKEAIKDFSILEVPDAEADERFRDSPLVTGAPNIRFYAGAPLTSSDGHNLGTLCVIDQKPRTLTELQKTALRALANNVVSQFELRRALAESEKARIKLAKTIEQKKSLQEKQQRTEKFMYQSLDAIPDHISIVNSEGKIVFVNRAWRKFAIGNSSSEDSADFGLNSNYLHVCERASLQGNEDASIILDALRAALFEESFAGIKHEYPCHSPNEKRWFIASVATLIIDEKHYAIISHHDVSRRKLAEMEVHKLVDTLDARVKKRSQELEIAYMDLRASEERHRTLFENSTVSFSISDTNGIFIDVNPAFCAFLGRARRQLIGNSIKSVIHPDDQEDIIHRRAEVLAGHSLGFVRDVRMLRSDGQYVWARASVGAIRDNYGKPVQTMNLLQDVTEQRKAEQERDQVFDKSVDMIAIVNADGKVLQANPAVSRVFGYSASKLGGMGLVDLIHPDDLEQTQLALVAMTAETFKEDLPVLEIRMRIKNGEYRDIRWNGARHNKEENLILIGRDVTKSRNSQRALHRLAARLQAIREEERTRISREIHDELGQILTALKIDLDLLRRDITGIGNQSLASNVGDIIDLVNSTLTSVKRIAQDLRPEILDALGLVPALEWQAKEIHARTGLDCEIECPRDIPALDGEQTTQIFRIIQEALTNVVRHSRATYARIILAVGKNGSLKITIKDNGMGFNVIEAESQSLGMLGMRERANNIGATLHFNSSLEKGTVVTLKLAASENSQVVVQ